MNMWWNMSLSVKLVNYTRDKRRSTDIFQLRMWKHTPGEYYVWILLDHTQSLHAMTMFDPATSWFEVVEIPNKRAITCANLVEITWLCRYPRPKPNAFLIMDQNSWGRSLQTRSTPMESNVFLQPLRILLPIW
jgi:hypothetical protein